MSESKWDKPQIVSGPDICFGGNMSDLLPAYNEIPTEFKQWNHPWVRWGRKWFFIGLGKHDIPEPNPGIDKQTALSHLAAIQTSFCPQHEHKEAAVAWLASKWFVEPK